MYCHIWVLREEKDDKAEHFRIGYPYLCKLEDVNILEVQFQINLIIFISQFWLRLYVCHTYQGNTVSIILATYWNTLSIVIKLIRGRKKQRLNIYQATSLLERLLFRCEFQRAIWGEKWEAPLQWKRAKAMPIEQVKARLGKASVPHPGMSRPACEQLSVTNVRTG